MTKINNKR